MKNLYLLILLIFITLNCDAQNKAQTIDYFEGTKKFCDSDGYWNYIVTISKNKIILKCYPGSKNTAHKNKKSPFRIINGIIKNGKILSKATGDMAANVFRFENNNLIEICAEDTESIYHLCK